MLSWFKFVNAYIWSYIFCNVTVYYYGKWVIWSDQACSVHGGQNNHEDNMYGLSWPWCSDEDWLGTLFSEAIPVRGSSINGHIQIYSRPETLQYSYLCLMSTYVICWHQDCHHGNAIWHMAGTSCDTRNGCKVFPAKFRLVSPCFFVCCNTFLL